MLWVVGAAGTLCALGRRGEFLEEEGEEEGDGRNQGEDESFRRGHGSYDGKRE